MKKNGSWLSNCKLEIKLSGDFGILLATINLLNKMNHREKGGGSLAKRHI
jgi:hypothetical protein